MPSICAARTRLPPQIRDTLDMLVAHLFERSGRQDFSKPTARAGFCKCSGKIVHVDKIARGNKAAPEITFSSSPHVSRPAMLHQHVLARRVRPLDLLVVGRVVLLHEKRDQQRDVFEALESGWERESGWCSSRRRGPRGSVRRQLRRAGRGWLRRSAGHRRGALRASPRAGFPGFESRAASLACMASGGFADFVEENSAAVGVFKQARRECRWRR